EERVEALAAEMEACVEGEDGEGDEGQGLSGPQELPRLVAFRSLHAWSDVGVPVAENRQGLDRHLGPVLERKPRVTRYPAPAGCGAGRAGGAPRAPRPGPSQA